MGKFLTKKQIEELKFAHRVEDKLKYGDRIKAILLLNEGWTAAQIAKVLLIDEKTVGNYRRMYEEGGTDRLCCDEYSGRESKLSEDQMEKLRQELLKKIYMSSTEVCEYVSKTFGVSYCVSGMTYLLKRIGFSYKKPMAVPGKADPQEQRDFVKRYQRLKQQKNPEEPIYFMDGTHPQHNSHPAYGWLPKGEATELKTNTGRQRVTLNGALNAETHEIIVREDLTLNAENTMDFFRTIERQHPDAKKVFIIVDNAGYFKGTRIQTFLKMSKIELIYLPPYSPNLNLIERVWKLFKKKVLANRYYESFLEFRAACMSFFTKKNLRSVRAELDSLLTENFQLFNA
jgi:transposase